MYSNSPEFKTRMAKHRTTIILLLLVVVVAKYCFVAIRTAIAVPSSSTMETEVLQHTHVGRTNRLWNHTESRPKKSTGLTLFFHRPVICHILSTGCPVVFGTPKSLAETNRIMFFFPSDTSPKIPNS